MSGIVGFVITPPLIHPIFCDYIFQRVTSALYEEFYKAELRTAVSDLFKFTSEARKKTNV